MTLKNNKRKQQLLMRVRLVRLEVIVGSVIGASALARAVAVSLVLGLFARAGVAANLLEIYRLALTQDPTLQSAYAQNRAAAQERLIAYSDYLPKIDVAIERSSTTQNVLSTENLVFSSGRAKFPTTNYTATLTQSVVNMAAIANIKRSTATIAASDADYQAARQDLILRTAEAYFNVLIAEDEYRYVQAEKASVEKNLQLVQAQHVSGLARITDLRDAEARHASVLSTESEDYKNLYDARLALEEIIGSEPQSLAGLVDSFELSSPSPDNKAAWVKAGISANPNVISLRAQLKAARQEVARLNAGHYPSIDISASYNRNDARGSLFGGGSEVETTNYALQLRVPILAGGRVYAQAKQASELLNQAQADLDRELRGVKHRTESSFIGIKSATVRVNAMTKAVEAQQLVKATKTQSYKAGLFTLIAVLDAERDLFIARRDLARAKYDFILESLRLERAAGSLDEDDIVRINAWLR